MNFSDEMEDKGFVILENVFTQKTLDIIRPLVDRIISYAEKDLEDPFEGYYLRHRADQGALYDLFQRHAEFQELAKNETLLDALEQIVGEDIFLYENSLVYKPKGKRNEVPWHQDFINRPNEPIKYIAWIALDDIKVENGAMKVIPGSHKLGFLPWHTVPGETHHTRLVMDNVDTSKAVDVELNAGDVLIFNQLLLHSSERIDSPAPRRAYRVSYQNFDQVFTPRASPVVLRGGSPESLANKFPNRHIEKREKKVNKNIVQKLLNRIGRKLIEI